jgi:hypothetical protein
MRHWRPWSIAVALLLLGCESLFIVPTNEEVGSWSEHRTLAGDRVIVYRLPPDPLVRIAPRRVAQLEPTSREAQAFVQVDYGYGLPEPRYAELDVVMEVRAVDGGPMLASWTPEEFARFYWARTKACHGALSPFNPKYEKMIESQLVALGDATWYQLVYPDLARGSRISGDSYLRPISSTHVLAVYGLYVDYELMSPEAIDRRRALMRKIVAEIRVEPPFGPPP